MAKKPPPRLAAARRAPPRPTGRPRPAAKPGRLTLRTIREAFDTCREGKSLRVFPLLRQALKSPQPDYRHSAMYILSAVWPGSRSLLANTLADPVAQWPALRILRDLGDARAKGAVKKLLGHREHKIRELAFRTLRRLEAERPQEETWTREVTVSGRLESLTTIIHGTWAEDETWWRWPAEFPQYLDSMTHDFYKGNDPFQWPGDNTPEAREKGARDLIVWLKTHPAGRVTLIAHSHGGNVVFKATELAGPGEIQIAKLVLLGTPIRDDYAPDVGKIGTLVNGYSEDDLVQWLGTWTPDMESHERDGGRILPDGPKVTNREVSTETESPHSELHTAELWKRERLGSLLI